MFRSWTEIQADYLQANLRELRSRLPLRCGVISVVKANAYGHGATNVAKVLKSDSSAFAVACLSEALELREAVQDRDILILGPSLPSERQEVVKHDFIPTVSSVEEAREYAKYAISQPVRLSIKIDTGMGRIGLWKDHAVASLNTLSRLRTVSVHSIATHLAAAVEDPIFSREQLEWMEEHASIFRKLFPGVLLHALHSAGILEFPDHAFDLVRPGLALYGIASPEKYQHRFKPALSWKTRVIEVREVGKGRCVSYGHTFTTSEPCRLATIAIGYADGYPVQLSSSPAYVLAQGLRCPIVGRVTMDQTVVSIPKGLQVSRGDEIVLIGEQQTEKITATDIAHWAGTIPWEILTRIHRRVKCLFRSGQ
ncbi:MAG: alanine racemase [Verrucomicrobia bacterium]|nr:MAG: alanine racemase [Verrucomicrobiota bacterium]